MLCTGIGLAEVSVGGQPGEIRRLLLQRQRELLNEIQSRVRDVREVGFNNHHHTAELHETVESEPEDDLAFALIQMKAETLGRVNEAVRQFDEGAYGCCADCGDVIVSSRLRAVPFAVRCRDCEETRENEQRRDRVRVQRVPPGVGSGD